VRNCISECLVSVVMRQVLISKPVGYKTSSYLIAYDYNLFNSCIRLDETIADSRFGDQQLWVRSVCFELLTQVSHVNAKIVRLLNRVRPPNFAKNVAMRQNLARVLNEQPKDRVLGCCELYLFASQLHQASSQIDLQITRIENTCF
jgi:hypothetical protein